MAYMIRLVNKDPGKVLDRLQKTIDKDGRFRFRAEIKGPDLVLQSIRLTSAKEYCGQHPGPCQIQMFGGPRPKRRYSILGWDDWVAFHGVVNDVLDRMKANADAWTNPRELMDEGKKFYVRRGQKRRVRYEWEERAGRYGRTEQVWNHGTDDQFVKEVVDERSETESEVGRRRRECVRGDRAVPESRQEGRVA